MIRLVQFVINSAQHFSSCQFSDKIGSEVTAALHPNPAAEPFFSSGSHSKLVAFCITWYWDETTIFSQVGIYCLPNPGGLNRHYGFLVWKVPVAIICLFLCSEVPRSTGLILTTLFSFNQCSDVLRTGSVSETGQGVMASLRDEILNLLIIYS